MVALADAERLIVEATAENPEAARLWEAATPRLRRQYVEWVAEALTPRNSRIAWG